MPVYTYKCCTCRKIFDVRHGMFFESQRCIECNSDDVFKLPPEGIMTKPPATKIAHTKPGKIVDRYISETKKEIKKEKEKLKSEEI